MSIDIKLKGLVLYFFFIEKIYGQLVVYWFGLLVGKKGFKYMELVSFLKSEYGLGYGYVNVLVVYYLVGNG